MGLSLEGLYVSRTRFQTVKITSSDVHWVMLNEHVYIYINWNKYVQSKCYSNYKVPVSNDIQW